MIAHSDDSRPPHDLPHDDVAAQAGALLERFATALRHRDCDGLMRCFGDHPVLMLTDHGVPVEGRGALRRYFQRSLPSALFADLPEIEEINRRHGERALVRAGARDAAGASVKLVVAIGRENARWVITHCHWSVVRGLAAA